MTTIQKIETLNKVCRGSLSINHFSDGWQINSYEDWTPLKMDFKYPYFKNNSLKRLVDEAYSFVFKEEK